MHKKIALEEAPVTLDSEVVESSIRSFQECFDQIPQVTEFTMRMLCRLAMRKVRTVSSEDMPVIMGLTLCNDGVYKRFAHVILERIATSGDPRASEFKLQVTQLIKNY